MPSDHCMLLLKGCVTAASSVTATVELEVVVSKKNFCVVGIGATISQTLCERNMSILTRYGQKIEVMLLVTPSTLPVCK